MNHPFFLGGFSTFLAIVLLTISDSYIFQTFFLVKYRVIHLLVDWVGLTWILSVQLSAQFCLG